jgi:hypothetical protein
MTTTEVALGPCAAGVCDDLLAGRHRRGVRERGQGEKRARDLRPCAGAAARQDGTRDAEGHERAGRAAPAPGRSAASETNSGSTKAKKASAALSWRSAST